jgi:NAD(P)-dependent dehydrogenase (short-subunit alcohol dehydrogenase family)
MADVPDPLGLKGRVALVTGSGRGLGRAYALALSRCGCSVVVNSPPRAEGASAEAVAAEIAAAGGRVAVHVGSVADPVRAVAAVDSAIDAFGSLDVLVSNAGVILNKPFLETTVDDLDGMVAVHLRGPFAAAQRAFAHMRERGWGRIVLTGTGSASFGLEGQSAYASAKAAVVALVHVLALEHRGGEVRANVVLPVAPPVGRTPASARIRELFAERAPRLDPEWVAPLVCLLASDACPGSGGVYSAVGGRYARVFTAVSRGWVAEGDTPPPAEELAGHLEEILDEGGYIIPRSLLDEIEQVALEQRGR